MIPVFLTLVTQFLFFAPHPLQQPPTTLETATTKSDAKPLELPAMGKWKSLFDGKSLANWKQSGFGGGGEVHLDAKFRMGEPAIVVDTGVALSGFNWTGDTLPKTDYEVMVEGLKIDGSDFFCGITFPVGDSHASLILGGWGGGTVGISSIDGHDASENETTKYMGFAKDKWFKIRVRVTAEKIEAWLDTKQIVDQKIAGKKISLRHGEIKYSIPLGLSTYQTSSAFRTIKIRRIDPKSTSKESEKP